MQIYKLLQPALLLLVPVMLLNGCASDSPLSKPVPGAPIPPLQAQARQPPLPAFCSETCSDAALKEFDSWLSTQTQQELQVKLVKAPTGR
jgi:hypothetical protein